MGVLFNPFSKLEAELIDSSKKAGILGGRGGGYGHNSSTTSIRGNLQELALHNLTFINQQDDR